MHIVMSRLSLCRSGRLVLLALVDLFEVGVDHRAVARRLAAGGTAAGRGTGARPGPGVAGTGLLGLVDRLAELHRRLGERFGLGLDLGGVARAEHALERRD